MITYTDTIFEDTIIAPATVPGTGAISIIRMSGPRSFEIADAAITLKSGSIATSDGYTIKYGNVYLEDGSLLDEVLVYVFRAPHSYTGEDSVEISFHASSYIARELMMRLTRLGARMADPGEFTKRAFAMKKMDLAQAEAVADVIASSDKASHDVAVNQLKGGYSAKLNEIRSGLLDITSLLELELDFSEEEVEFADRFRLTSLVSDAVKKINTLADSFALGNAVKNGVPVVIAGAVNAGKSTLLNALTGEERAIVSSVAGTTRDTIEETVSLGGISFRFIDTAGIRETSEEVEKIGIGRSFKALKSSAIILLLVDITRPFEQIKSDISPIIESEVYPSAKWIICCNKTDILPESLSQNDINTKVTDINDFVLSSINKENDQNIVSEDIFTLTISSKTGEGLDQLRSALIDSQKDLLADSTNGTMTLVTNIRHYEALVKSSEALNRVLTALADGIPSDLVAQDLREAIHHMGSITGAITTDQILGNIFSKFCIGK